MSIFSKALGGLKSLKDRFTTGIKRFTKDIAQRVKRDLSTAVDSIVNRKAPKGTKKNVEVSENGITVEIKTPNKEIKEDIRQSGNDALSKAEKRADDFTERTAQRLADETPNFKKLREEINNGETIDPRDFLHEYDIKDRKNLFSSEQWEKSKGYVWKKVQDYFQSETGNMWEKVYQRAKQIILQGRDHSLLHFGDLFDDYRTLRHEHGNDVDKYFQSELDDISDNIIKTINEEMWNDVTAKTKDILRKYKK